jgi:putative two-component system response regulator
VARCASILAGQLARNSAYAPFVSREFVESIRECAVLHDIGKVALPTSIVLKAEELSPEETAVLQSHTTIGRDICLSVKEEVGAERDALIDMAAEVTVAHHERWDGEGYPARLRGAAIPLSARIVGLADYYDVWRSPMAYRPEVLPEQEVVERIVSQSGAKFDPVVVGAFRRCRQALAEGAGAQ